MGDAVDRLREKLQGQPDPYPLLDDEDLEMALSWGDNLGLEVVALSKGSTLDRSPKKNWVENAGGLPKYIEEVAKKLHEGGMDISRAIATAVSQIKKWAVTGKPDTKAKAAAAIAQWEKMKASRKKKG